MYELPDGWEWKTIEDLCEILDRLRKPISQKDRISGEFPYYGASGILDYINDFIFDERLLLIGEDGAKWGANENTAFIADGKYWVNNHAHIMRPNKDLVIDSLLVYYLNTTDLDEYITGATVKKLNQQKLKSIMIPLPPLPEQQRIVSKLDLLFEKIDKSIALHQKNMDEANAFMESVLNDVFGELEEKYGLTILSTVVKINSGIALPSIFKDKEITDGEYEFFKVAQMNNDKKVMKNADLNFTFLQSKEYKIKLFPKGSILIPKRGGAILTNKKRILERDASYDSNVMGLKANNKILSDEFLFLFLNSIDLADYIDTTTIPQINNKHIDMMNISIPPLPIQQKVVTYLDEISQKTEKIKQLQKEKMASLGALKASILDSAFRGEL